MPSATPIDVVIGGTGVALMAPVGSPALHDRMTGHADPKEIKVTTSPDPAAAGSWPPAQVLDTWLDEDRELSKSVVMFSLALHGRFNADPWDYRPLTRDDIVRGCALTLIGVLDQWRPTGWPRDYHLATTPCHHPNG